MRLVHAAAVVAVPLLMFAVPATATAGDAVLPNVDLYPYQPPIVSLVSDDSSITATVTNPNTQGICYLTIGIDSSVHIFTEDHNALWPGAGQTVTLTHSGLAPGLYSLNGFCAMTEHTAGQSVPVDLQIRVGPEPEQPGTGSLGFGSLGI